MGWPAVIAQKNALSDSSVQITKTFWRSRIYFHDLLALNIKHT